MLTFSLFIKTKERFLLFMSELPKVSRQEFLKLKNSVAVNQFNNYSNDSVDPPDNNNYFNDYDDQPEPPNKHPWLKFLKWLLFMIIGLIAIFGFLEYQKVHETSNKVFSTKSAKINARVKQGKPITVLAMGTDVGALDRGNTGGNTDSLELFTLNPKKQTITMTSIPRDILVRVNTHDGADYVKLNAAYAINGPKQTVKQISELLNVPIDYYAVINMGVLQKFVNSVGGVDVNNPFAFDYEGHHFPQGTQHLNGRLALKYSRMRYDDPNNDYGRQKRQQQILASVIQTFKQKGSLKAANEILDAVGDGVKTNVPINHVNTLYQKYNNSLTHIKTEHFQGQTAVIDGVSFQIASTNEINRVSKLLHQQLGTSYEKVVNHETKMYDSQPNYNGTDENTFILPGHAQYNTPGSGNGSDFVETKQHEEEVKNDAALLTSSDIFG